MIDISAYEFSPLHQDGAVEVYRGRTDHGASILLAAAAESNITLEAIKRLEHALSLRDRLDPRWAARPLALTHYRQRLALVIEDPGGDTLLKVLGRPLDVREFLRLAISLAAACRQMHEAGLIHRDIRPTNLLVDEVAGTAWLTGFGFAGVQDRHSGITTSPEPVSGTLAYMAPEQTGRMNRPVDFRTDLYSLGVTFYEMLTGSLPFAADEPMKWVYAHLARPPEPPNQRTPTIPETVSSIAMKLLAKDMEQRYQSAGGLEVDLRICIAAWESTGQIDPFQLGEYDCSIGAWHPPRIYGREHDLDVLLRAVDEGLTDGRPQAVFVSGHSGIGKTSLVEQVRSKQEPTRMLFAAAKCDQFKQSAPYGALAHVFRDLVRTLLGADEVELRRWRAVLIEALGPHASLIANLIPELELVIGPAPSPQGLPAQDAHSRFQRVFLRFLAAFCRRERPLILFLDDLQWLDPASFDFIAYVLQHDEARDVIFIGAYRDNEVSSDHPLFAALESIRAAGGRMHEIALAPLRPSDIKALLADSLRSTAVRVSELAELVYSKSYGNPLFALQFLTELNEEKLLTFDPVSVCWTWELSKIRSRDHSDSILDLLLTKMNRLPADLRDLLKQLAYLGSTAELATLSIVRGESVGEIRTFCEELARIGLLVGDAGRYGFHHDRIHEAAYALVPEPERAAEHLRIGRVLSNGREITELGDQIFEITNQFNLGTAAIDSSDEKQRAAALNLVAARRAKEATAYSSALVYLVAAGSLLGERRSDALYRLAFDIALCRAECELLSSLFEVAEGRLRELRDRATSLPDKLAVARLRVALHVTRDQANIAAAVGTEFLNQLGEPWSLKPSEAGVNEEIERLRRHLREKSLDRILEFPIMSNPECKAAMDILADLMPPAEFTDPTLLDLIILRMANLSFEFGNCDASCYGYAALHLVLGARLGDDELGYQFARLGCVLVEKAELAAFKARVHLCVGGLVIPWTRALVSGQPLIRRAFDEANLMGDVTFASYSKTMLVTLLLASGTRLDAVEEEAETGIGYARRAGFGLVTDCLTGQLMLTRGLRGRPPRFVRVDGILQSQESFEQCLENPRLAIAACWYWIKKSQLCYLTHEYVEADRAAAKAATFIWSTGRHFERAEYHFYGALICASQCSDRLPDERQKHWQALLEHRGKIDACAKHCSENFADRAALIGAEVARLEGRDLDAEKLYEEAIRLSREHAFVQNEAIANEIASQFYRKRGLETIALAYLRNARQAYLRWGASEKVRQLSEANPQLDAHSLQHVYPVETTTEQMELATVIRVSQAVSSQLDLEQLINTLLVIALQHAGADRGLLILRGSRGDTIEAEASVVGDSVTVNPRGSEVTAADLPLSILQFVSRSRETLLLDDAVKPHPFSGDEYFHANHCRSVLCEPLVKQGRLIGLLYLENNQASSVFTEGRVGVLSLLASQAAISLEIARVHSELRTENQERKKAEEALRASESSLALGQQISHTCSWRWNVRTGAARVSAEWYRIYGLDSSVGSVSYETVIARSHPDDRAMLGRALSQAARDRTSFMVEFRIVLPDGSVKQLQSRGKPDVSLSDDLEFVGTDIDITELRQAEEKLRRMQADLARASRLSAMGELAGSIVHEINQPLTAIVTNVEACLRWLKRDQPDVTEAINAAADAVREGRRAGDVVAGLKSLARKSGSEMKDVDAHEAIREVLTLVRAELEGGGVSLQLDLYEGEARVRGDRVQIQQVLINLIRNGMEAMNSITGRGKLMQICSTAGSSQKLLITVEDRGTGLERAYADKIFDPMFTTKPNGMGMGLAICRSIVEAHRGQIWATPRAPHGTAVSFTLPLVVD